MLDEEGFGEASALLSDTLERLAEVERRAKQRLKERSTVDRLSAVAVVMLLDEPSLVEGALDDKNRASRPRRSRAAHAQ